VDRSHLARSWPVARLGAVCMVEKRSVWALGRGRRATDIGRYSKATPGGGWAYPPCHSRQGSVMPGLRSLIAAAAFEAAVGIVTCRHHPLEANEARTQRSSQGLPWPLARPSLGYLRSCRLSAFWVRLKKGRALGAWSRSACAMFGCWAGA